MGRIFNFLFKKKKQQTTQSDLSKDSDSSYYSLLDKESRMRSDYIKLSLHPND